MNTTNDPVTRLLGRLFDLASRAPLPFLAVILALQTGFLLESRELWFSDEIRYANVYEHLANAGKWVVMHLNGEYYPDKPPVYFWFLHALSPLVDGVKPALFFLGAAVSGFFYLCSGYVLARTVAKARPAMALAMGLALLSTFYFVGLTHYSRMDLLFAGFILLSHCALFRAAQQERAMGWMVLGFFLAGVATLTKGPLGFAFPLLAMAGWLFWTGRPSRLLRKDVAAGVGVCVLLALAWLGAAWYVEGPEFLENIFVKQIYKRAADTWHHGQPWYYYFYGLPLTFLPWTLLFFFLPWTSLPDTLSKTWLQRKAPESHGMSYVWAILVTGFVLLTGLSIKIAVYLIPLFAPLALVAVLHMDHMRENRSRWLFAAVGGLFALLATAFLGLSVVRPLVVQGVVPAPEGYLPALPGWHAALTGAVPCLIICALAAWLLLRKMDRREPMACLLLCVLTVTALLQPLGLVLAPRLDAIMSPKGQAELMASYAEQGYEPMAYKIYSGTYTYYLGQNLPEFKEVEELEAALQTTDKAVIGMQRKRWDRWETKPGHLQIVDERIIVERPYLLILHDRSLMAPAVPEDASAPLEIDPEPEVPQGTADNATTQTEANATAGTSETPAD